MTDNYILDTNIIIDFQSAEILSHLNCNLFFVSNVVYNEEISKQIKSDSYHQLNLINESYEEVIRKTIDSLCVSSLIHAHEVYAVAIKII